MTKERVIAIKYRRYYYPEVFGVSSYDELPPMPEDVIFEELNVAGIATFSNAWAGADGHESNSEVLNIFKDKGLRFLQKPTSASGRHISFSI